MCDVIDVYYVLLGRPWKFDKGAIHDGKINTYNFEMDGERHTIIPFKDEGMTTKINNPLLILNAKEFLE